jgi:hypothetical protein
MQLRFKGAQKTGGGGEAVSCFVWQLDIRRGNFYLSHVSERLDLPPVAIYTAAWCAMSQQRKVAKVSFGLRSPTASPNHCAGVNAIVFDEKRGILFTASRDATVRQWLVPPGEVCDIPIFLIDFMAI